MKASQLAPPPVCPHLRVVDGQLELGQGVHLAEDRAGISPLHLRLDIEPIE